MTTLQRIAAPFHINDVKYVAVPEDGPEDVQIIMGTMDQLTGLDGGSDTLYVEVWRGHRIVDFTYEADREIALAVADRWIGGGGSGPEDMTQFDPPLRTQTQEEWWSEDCDPATGRISR